MAPGIYERGPHQFQVKIRRNGASISRTFETVKSAKAWRDVQLGKIVAHDFVDRSKERRTNLRDLLQRYLEDETPTKKGNRQEDDQAKLLEACARGLHWLPLVVKVALATGMRQGETRCSA